MFNERSYPVLQRGAVQQPRRPLQPHYYTNGQYSGPGYVAMAPVRANDIVSLNILRLRAMQSLLVTQPRYFAPLSPSMPPLFPFPPPLPMRPQPPMLYTDYSCHLNLPAPPLDRIFQSAYMWPRWWTTSIPPLDETILYTPRPLRAPTLLPPPSTITGPADQLNYDDLLKIYEGNDDKQLLCTAPTIPTSTQPTMTQTSTAFSPILPIPSISPLQTAAGGSAESFLFPPLLAESSTCPILPLSEKEPPYSYTGLAALAISAYPQRIATLNEIYSFIASTFPYYKRSQRAWKNSIRHCLQHTDCFKMVCDGRGKCVYWTVDSNSKTHVLKGSFKAKKHSCTVNRVKKTLKELDEESRGYFEPSKITSIPNKETDIVNLFPPDNNDTASTLVSINVN